jgi:hypothetical protein
LLLSQLPVFQSHVDDKKTTMGHVTKKDLQRIRVSLPPRIARHRPHPRHAGRQNRSQPPPERNAGADGAGALQGVVRGL